jgi:peptidoglycan/LPS O-acetylase OafA/YrhL
LKYRRDIDGLRAIAVLPVVLYHAGVPGFGGGYVGVDVFFVISGYLITSILATGQEQGGASLLAFYDRRVRRIIPAYLVVMVATTMASLVVLPPDALADYGRRLISTAVFASNFYFRSETNYFASEAELNPLLHTWSLSVEEQFYLAWPIALMLLGAWMAPRVRALLIWLALVASLALAIFFVYFKSPAAGFYYSPARAWELLAGGVLALGFVPAGGGRRVREVLSALGMALILVPIVLYPPEIPFPGLTAVPAVLGATLIIWASRDTPTTVSRILSAKPLWLVGLVSYSFYLWHWPLISLAKSALSRDLFLWEGVGLATLGLGLAALSWRFVEQPFRGRPQTRTRIPISLPIAAAALLSLVALGALLARDGLSGRADASTLRAISERDEPSDGLLCLTELRAYDDPATSGCRIGAPAAAPAIALIGDSHAAHFGPVFDAYGKARKLGVVQWTKASCSPAQLGRGGTTAVVRSCNAYLSALLDQLRVTPSITTVAIGGNWTAADRADTGLTTMVETLKAAGLKVLVIGEIPEFERGGGDCVVRSRFLGIAEQRCWEQAATQVARMRQAEAWVALRTGGVPPVLVSREFCDEVWCKPTDAEGRVIMADDQHLNPLGAMATSGIFFASLDDLRARP